VPEKKQPKRCFVIMPFSKTTSKHTEDYWTAHFKDFLKPLIEEHPNVEAFRSEALRVDIVRQIIADLLSYDVVVADLTDRNPNVYWELGIRQSFKHGTITVAEEGTKLASDIEKKGTLFYENNRLATVEFSRKLKKAITDCLDNPEKCDSPVLESITGRGTIFEMFQRDEALRRLEAVLSECDSNLKLFNKYLQQSKKNQEIRTAGKEADKKEKIIFPTRLFRSLALELLIAQRYIEGKPEFYTDAESMHDMIIGINEMLGYWTGNATYVEEWLAKVESPWDNFVPQFRESIVTVKNRLAQNI
jgi:hypothetical protein